MTSPSCLQIFLTATLIFFVWSPSSIRASTEFIKSKCTSTDYPNLCIASLSAYATTINDNPVRLADAALNVSLRSAKATSSMMADLKPSSPHEAQAVSDCLETLKDSVSYLRQSLREMDRLKGKGKGKGKGVAERISDVQTWVSTALTDESTCMDGFGGSVNGGAESSSMAKMPAKPRVEGAVRGRVVRVAHLTSNALALIGGLLPQNR